MVTPDVIVFDMDGVLVDVSASYREAIIATVKQLTGKAPTHEQIQEYKNQGGWNNDWALSQRFCAGFGVDLPYEEVVRAFNELFYGGYFQRERWIAAEGLLERLAASYPLYIFTGRLNEEAQLTLRRFEATRYFTDVVGDDNVSKPKPDADGLFRIAQRHPGAGLLYLGDTVDDAVAAAAAEVPFIGVGHEKELLRRRGALACIDSINELEAILR